MKAILLFTVLLCSNAVASLVDFPKPRLTSNEPVHIIDINEPVHIIHINNLPEKILPSTPSTERSVLASTSSLTGPPSTEPRLPSPVDKFLHICQSHRYLACRKYALLLKESTGEFARENLLQEALQRAVKEGNGWAVSALSDVVEFDEDFYFGILENYVKERKSNQDLITLDVLRRKSIEMDPDGAWWLARGYGYLDYIETYTCPMGKCILLDESSVAAIKEAIKISNREQVYTLIQAFFPYGLCKADILSYACQYGDQFAVFYATKDLLQSSGLKQTSILHDAYKQAIKFGNKDAVEFFQKFDGIHGKKEIGTTRAFTFTEAKHQPATGQPDYIDQLRIDSSWT